MGTLRAPAQVFTTIKSRVDVGVTLLVIAQLPVSLTPARPASSVESALAERPARHLLFRVFRI
jgi:hypothetical protein